MSDASDADQSPSSSFVPRDETAGSQRLTRERLAKALTRLALQSPPHRPDHRRVVADAEEAMQQVEAAATFLDDGGEADLRRAITMATRWGAEGVAERGSDVLATVARYRTAASRTADSD